MTELAALLEAAKAGRHGTRNHLLLTTMFRHGLRASESPLRRNYGHAVLIARRRDLNPIS